MSRPVPDRTVGRNEISEAAHAVLDHLDEHQEQWADLLLCDHQIVKAATVSGQAVHAWENSTLIDCRALLIEAAARTIDAIGEIDRCIAAGGQ